MRIAKSLEPGRTQPGRWTWADGRQNCTGPRETVSRGQVRTDEGKESQAMQGQKFVLPDLLPDRNNKPSAPLAYCARTRIMRPAGRSHRASGACPARRSRPPPSLLKFAGSGCHAPRFPLACGGEGSCSRVPAWCPSGSGRELCRGGPQAAPTGGLRAARAACMLMAAWRSPRAKGGRHETGFV